jgi:hypothetical protein
MKFSSIPIGKTRKGSQRCCLVLAELCTVDTKYLRAWATSKNERKLRRKMERERGSTTNDWLFQYALSLGGLPFPPCASFGWPTYICICNGQRTSETFC